MAHLLCGEVVIFGSLGVVASNLQIFFFFRKCSNISLWGCWMKLWWICTFMDCAWWVRFSYLSSQKVVLDCAHVYIYILFFILVVPCIVILGWRNPTRCKSMQIQSNLGSRTPRIMNNSVYEQILWTQSVPDDVLSLELRTRKWCQETEKRKRTPFQTITFHFLTTFHLRRQLSSIQVRWN